MIKKILIANRAEIAVRIISAARELGISTVAVCSAPDEDSLHTWIADEHVKLGGQTPSESYLDIAKIIDAAEATQAEAIHPGYGFLSERAEFAEACEQAGLIFIGPTPNAMRMLGSKMSAKQLAQSLEIPVVPGYFGEDNNAQKLLEEAKKMGFPVLLKASAGGGGRGMRIVEKEQEFIRSFELAAEEAKKAFGNDAMMIEKYISQPRHIEMQILADHYGNIVTFYERECSLQRRYQKLIEEAPSPLFINTETHFVTTIFSQMQQAAIKLAKAVNYQGAGTVEFMVDEINKQFYFLEVNTRLQVEHPVTELITGIDLVQAQIQIAAGKTLSEIEISNADQRENIRGHAIEARIVAEDPENNFLPSVGKIIGWSEPHMPGVRIDTGYGHGSNVSQFYDSLLAKVIVHAQTRLLALSKLKKTLQEFHILGVKTNIAFLIDLLDHQNVREGNIDTKFIEREFSNWSKSNEIPDFLPELYKQSFSLLSLTKSNKSIDSKDNVWFTEDNWRNVCS